MALNIFSQFNGSHASLNFFNPREAIDRLTFSFMWRDGARSGLDAAERGSRRGEPDRMTSDPTAGSGFGPRFRGGVVRALEIIAIVAGGAGLVASLFVHLRFIAYPAPQEITESATLYATFQLSMGQNPWTVESFPASTQFFGPFYNYVVLAFKPLFGIGYGAHRFVNLFCLGAIFSYLGSHLRRLGASLGVVLCCLSTLYWLVMDNIMITARPDILGWGLFLVALLHPFSRGYRVGPSLIGLFFALLAFQGKAYFIAAGGATLLGLALLHSWPLAIILGVGFGSAVVLSVWVTTYFFPLYYVQSFVMSASMVRGNASNEMMMTHDRLFIARAWPFLLLLLMALYLRWRDATAGDGHRSVAWLRLIIWKKFVPRSPNQVLGLVFIIWLPMVLIYMARNGGAWFTYHTHLLFPLIFLMVALAVRDVRLRSVSQLGLAVFAVAGLQLRWTPDDTTPHHRVARVIADEREEVYAGTSYVDALLGQGRPVYETGFTVFHGFVMPEEKTPANSVRHALFARSTELRRQLTAKVERQEFGLVVTEDETSFGVDLEVIRRNYKIVERFQHPTYFGHGEVLFWRRRQLEPAVNDASVRAGP